jgi:cyclic pyranopterin phosphate synthase
MSELHDAFGRRIDYFRISVTDRCNLRCVYCMPPEGVQLEPHANMLRYEEIVQVVETAAALGIRKVRLTGGEPLIRPDVTWLVQSIARIPGIEEISLTTNGMLLEKLATPLAQAGLHRINVSLDTLDPDKFRRLTRFGSIDKVWRGIEAAERAGLTPIKLNAVVIRGVNDDELVDLARLTVDHAWHVRFIELMPVGNEDDWGDGFPQVGNRYFSVQEMLDRLSPLSMTPAEQPVGNGPARTYRIPGAPGSVGFISPLGDHFCSACNRLRLTADGRLRPCLLNDGEMPVREAIRAGKAIAPLVEKAVVLKPRGHELLAEHMTSPQNRMMCQIGG